MLSFAPDLFNLIPFAPLDGVRRTAVLALAQLTAAWHFDPKPPWIVFLSVIAYDLHQELQARI